MQLEINVMEFLNEVLSTQKLVSQGLNMKIDESYKDSDLIVFFNFIQKEKLAASASISEKIADYCQLLNEKNNYKDLSLETVCEVYRIASQNNPFDISLYESLSYYLDEVLDKPDEAKRVLMSGIEIVQKKLDEAKKYLNAI